MAHYVHRKGTRYRIWSTFMDRYVTGSMTRKQVTQWLEREAEEKAKEQLREAIRDIKTRLERTDKNGTSSLLGPRDASKWDTERCMCGNFHHTYESAPNRHTSCKVCGEPPDDIAHKPPCKKKRVKG